ncbi:MAG: hypothetical protein QOE92_1683 [Chloroflexota bacterium]|jgi:hypothetical protein|nr:hypothetical protein [Chloroflexota bacterium]
MLLALLESPIFVIWGVILAGYSAVSRTSGTWRRTGAAVGYGLAISILLILLTVIAVTGACSVWGCSGVD